MKLIIMDIASDLPPEILLIIIRHLDDKSKSKHFNMMTKFSFSNVCRKFRDICNEHVWPKYSYRINMMDEICDNIFGLIDNMCFNDMHEYVFEHYKMFIEAIKKLVWDNKSIELMLIFNTNYINDYDINHKTPYTYCIMKENKNKKLLKLVLQIGMSPEMMESFKKTNGKIIAIEAAQFIIDNF